MAELLPFLKVCSASNGNQCIQRLVKFSEGAGSRWPRTGNTKCELNVLLSRSVMFLIAWYRSAPLPLYAAAMMSLLEETDLFYFYFE